MIGKLKTKVEILKLLKNYPTYFKDLFKLVRSKYIIYNFRDGTQIKLRANTGDRALINEIFLYKIYNPPGFEVNDSDLIIDIGGHIGLFAISAAKYTKNKVYTIEPAPSNLYLLKENITLNNAKNIQVIPKAISDKSGKAELFVSGTEADTGSNSFFQSMVRQPRLGQNTPTGKKMK